MKIQEWPEQGGIEIQGQESFLTQKGTNISKQLLGSLTYSVISLSPESAK